MYPSFAEQYFENSFSRSFLLHLPFNKPMPITYTEGIKRPCNPSGTELLTFMREREMGEWLVTTVYNSPYRINSPLTFTFAIVRSCRGSKRKIIRMILTVPYNLFLSFTSFLIKLYQYWYLLLSAVLVYRSGFITYGVVQYLNLLRG